MVDFGPITTTIDRSAHKVLVVDDNAATRYSTARVLRAAGFQTAEAGSGTEALARAADGVSAMVLDVHLPDVDGFEVCRQVRANAALQLLPVIHLSAAYVKNEDQVTGLNSGADAYMIHPVEPALLVATLQALIRARTAEIQQRQSEQRLRAIYDQAQPGIAVLDREGRLQDGNPALLRLLRVQLPDVQGRALGTLVPPAWAEFVQANLGNDGPLHQPWRGEFPLLDADGGEVHLEWSISGLVEPGLRIAVVTDVSQRRELEQRRLELLEREQAARAMAERHNRTKDDFIAILSHELRTPLNAIMGWVHVLKRRTAGDETGRGLDAIERNVKTQARIISDILDVARIGSGKLRLEYDEVDPVELVERSLASLDTLFAERRIELVTDLDADGRRAWVDPDRFQQILWNLLTNAIKFSPEGARIEVGLRHRDGGIELQVRDHGQGIQAEFLPHLFDRFTQSDAPANRRQGGLGLGLSIVKDLVDLHGGTVSAGSDGPGQGTRMRVWLPAQPRGPGAEAPAADDATDAATPASNGLSGVRVLVVEDDRDTLAMLTMILVEHGAMVASATSYEGAVAELDRRWPDVLVSDIGLPGRDGLELIRHARRRAPSGATLRAIAVTAFARTEDQRRALDAGFDLHLSKPFTPHALLEAITAGRRGADS